MTHNRTLSAWGSKTLEFREPINPWAGISGENVTAQSRAGVGFKDNLLRSLWEDLVSERLSDLF